MRRAVAPIGDLIAIGEPGEELPKPGAARVYISHDGWQDRVEAEIRKARLVVVRAGKTPGVFWELGRCRVLLEPHQLLVQVNLSKRRYRAFREAALDAGMELPEVNTLPAGRISGLISFNDNWVPSYSPLVAPFNRRSLASEEFSQFRSVLQPTFEKLGVLWEPPPKAAWPYLKWPWLILAVLGITQAFVVALAEQ